MKSVDTLVIGGGQAGLATSCHLSRLGREHVVLEAGRIGETWRSRRWDSFTLVTPSWAIRLPSGPSVPGDPGGFLPRDDVVGMLQQYATDIAAPVREGVAVRSLEQGRDGGGFLADTTDGPVRARNVVVATGFFATARLPVFAREIDSSVVQLDATAYRNPADLPDGGVLVVGSGQSGVQIVEDLALAGRDVWLSVGRAGRFPRRYRGREIFEWAEAIGLLAMTEDKAPDPRGRFGPNPHLTGARGGHTINLHRFARDGIHLVGRVTGADGRRLRIDPDLHERLRGADQFAAQIKGGIDKFIAATGSDAPPADAANSDDHVGLEGFGVPLTEALDLERNGITTVIWAAGFLPDWSWIRLPIFDRQGQPIHDAGVTTQTGLAFVGLRYQRWLKSDLLYGVGDDAEHVVERLASSGPDR
jgi:putative flavoprotein involved in K+ transport